MTDTPKGSKGSRERSISRRWPKERPSFSLTLSRHFEDHKKPPVSRERRRLPQGNQSCRRATGNAPHDRQMLPISAPRKPHQSSQRNRTTGSLSPARLVPFFAAPDTHRHQSARSYIATGCGANVKPKEAGGKPSTARTRTGSEAGCARQVASEQRSRKVIKAYQVEQATRENRFRTLLSWGRLSQMDTPYPSDFFRILISSRLIF
jgi:hypothetical protein